MEFIQEIIYQKSEACVINLDKYANLGTPWVAI